VAAHRENGQHIGHAGAVRVSLTIRWEVLPSIPFLLRRISMSTNMIEKIFGLSGMKCLKVLSLSRNYIKQISGLVKRT